MLFKRLISFLIVIFGFILLSLAQAHGELPVVRIGLVVDGTWERDDALQGLFEGEILAVPSENVVLLAILAFTLIQVISP